MSHTKDLTKSQEILKKIMEDIRTCSKEVRYEYNELTGEVSPPELKGIKGFQLERLYPGLAIYRIEETYLGLQARKLAIGRTKGGNFLSIHSVFFKERYLTVKQRLEKFWEIRLKMGIRPGPDVITDGLYAELPTTVFGKERVLSIQTMPRDVYPHIALPEVGCNHFSN